MVPPLAVREKYLLLNRPLFNKRCSGLSRDREAPTSVAGFAKRATLGQGSSGGASSSVSSRLFASAEEGEARIYIIRSRTSSSHLHPDLVLVLLLVNQVHDLTPLHLHFTHLQNG